MVAKPLAVPAAGLAPLEDLASEAIFFDVIRIKEYTYVCDLGQTVLMCNVSLTMLRRLLGGDGCLGAEGFKCSFPMVRQVSGCCR